MSTRRNRPGGRAAVTDLFVSDVDHTLLDDEGRLSCYSRTTLNRLLARGLRFTVASARSCASLRSLLAGLELSLPVIEFNGAFVSDLATGRHHLVHALAPAVAADLWALAQAGGHVPFVSTHDGNADRLYYDRVRNAGMEWYLEDRRRHRDPRLCRLANLRDGLRDQVVCLTVIERRCGLLALQRAVDQRHGNAVRSYCFENRYSPGWHWLTLLDRCATKEQGVAALRRLRPELQGCRLVAFGDGANDIGLLQAADVGLAVANAEPELKRQATAVIGSNDDDAVARYLGDHWTPSCG